ncbi:hypothetical protein CIL06_21320 [Pantoea vagans]|nr:hypothetical protein CIL06_21320 [Pantoea vagans]
MVFIPPEFLKHRNGVYEQPAKHQFSIHLCHDNVPVLRDKRTIDSKNRTLHNAGLGMISVGWH